MKYLGLIALITALLLLDHCAIFDYEDDGEIPRDTIGILEIEFIIPGYQIPEGRIHQVDLSIAYDLDSAMDGLFLQKANVSDHKHIYQFTLVEREYYFRAAISCACGGDTCAEGGFPGGQYDIFYTYEQVEVTGGKTSRYTTKFD